jgi:hypothetical protein
LRTVHFALIALAVVAIISGRSPDVEKMRKAKSQLESVRDFFESALPKEHEQYDRIDVPEPWRFWWVIDGKEKIAGRLPMELQVLITDDSCAPGTHYSEITANDFERTLLDDKHSMRSFQEAWERLQCSTIEFYNTDLAWEILAKESRGKRVYIEMASHDSLKNKHFTLVPLQSFDYPTAYRPEGPALPKAERGLMSYLHFPGIGTNLLTLKGIGDHWVSVSMVAGELVKVAANRHFTARGNGLLVGLESTWTCTNRYAVCFRELAEIAAGREHYALKDLSQWLDDELAHTEPRQIDVFGIKFPAGAQFEWGIILIVVVQLYFWLHVRELSPRLEGGHPGLDVAWPGLYPSWAAYAVVWGSVVAVPLYGLWILGLNRIHYRPPFRPFLRSNWLDITLWMAIPLAVYTILSVWSCLTLRRLALLAQAARQENESKASEQEASSTAKAGAE